MIEVQNICFRYAKDQPPVLENLSLKIQPGEWVTVIGPNGSGKSTLARHLNGLLLPDSGSVVVDGLNTASAKDVWQIRQEVAFVFQNPDNQIVATTVEDDVAFGPENLGLSPAEITTRVEQALKITGLLERRSQQPYLLSGGEKQRVAIAGALAMASKYIILDEPTSMLDPGLRKQVLDVLQQLYSQYGIAIIYITNIMEEAILADRVVLMSQGHIVKDASPRAMFADSKYLEDIGLSVPAVCRLAGRLTETGVDCQNALTVNELVDVLCKKNCNR